MEPGKYYIGVACTFHDSGISILNEAGEILFAEATERYIQNKRAPGIICDERTYFTDLVRKFCPDGREFVISYSWSKSYFNKLKLQANTGILGIKKRFADYCLKNIPSNILTSYDLVGLAYLQLSSMYQVEVLLNKSLRALHKDCRIQNVFIDHHLTHAAYGCYTSPFDEASCVVMDGVGEQGSFSVYYYRDNKIQPLYIQNTMASLGLFYGLITSLCGFDPYKGEQWKVMGLAAYGKFDQRIYDLLKKMIKLRGLRLKFNLIRPWVDSLKALSVISKDSTQCFQSKADLAFTGQFVFAEIMETVLNSVCKINSSSNLVYTGGCALNSSFNGQILKRTCFNELYIPPAPSDDGNAIGAALVSYYNDHPQKTSRHKNHSPYLGATMSEFTKDNLFKFGGIPNVKKLNGNASEIAAKLLAEGKILGWVNGRAEFGPRALGNRSILADPRLPGMKDKINASIKFREEFRPFAPSILHEFGPDYFEDYEDSPYMERTLVYKKEMLEKIPAVVHVDNTGRVQSVKEETNSMFYNLIRSFYQETGIPMVLNTSFNIMGKPIIHSVEDAVGVFFTSGLDAMVIDDYLIEK